MKKYKVLGIMSGTSLDGLDIAYCTFKFKKKWKFSIKKTITIPYAKEWKNKLKDSIFNNEEQLKLLNDSYGIYIGIQCSSFIKEHGLKPNLIASHGHTVFHQPEKGYTLQIGNGEMISKLTNKSTVYDFRSLDVKLGGQGAPLVPIGDKLLFSEYDFCLNLGGFANISFDKNNKRIAYDICPANIVLNELAESIGKAFDENGKIAKKGKINSDLLQKLNDLEYYSQTHPKSLGKEFVIEKIKPVLQENEMPIEDKLRTFNEHIAQQIANSINSESGKNMLVTGGGAHNSFLIELLKEKCNKEIIIPSNEIIDYKEAIIFAFLGVLKLRNETNCLSSVTGAKMDSVVGVLAE